MKIWSSKDIVSQRYEIQRLWFIMNSKIINLKLLIQSRYEDIIFRLYWFVINSKITFNEDRYLFNEDMKLKSSKDINLLNIWRFEDIDQLNEDKYKSNEDINMQSSKDINFQRYGDAWNWFKDIDSMIVWRYNLQDILIFDWFEDNHSMVIWN